jgi:hypothetical protein
VPFTHQLACRRRSHIFVVKPVNRSPGVPRLQNSFSICPQTRFSALVGMPDTLRGQNASKARLEQLPTVAQKRQIRPFFLVLSLIENEKTDSDETLYLCWFHWGFGLKNTVNLQGQFET